MLETRDGWNWWKTSDQVQEAHAEACKKNMTNALSKLCRFVFVFLPFYSDMLRMLQAAMPEMWNVKMKSQIMQWVVHAGANRRKMTNGSWKMRRFICCFFLFCFLTCSVCLLWNSVHVNRERCEERRSDKRCMKKMQKQMHEYKICTRSCMEKYVSEKLCRISYHAEYTWHAVAWCCFGETAC